MSLLTDTSIDGLLIPSKDEWEQNDTTKKRKIIDSKF